MSKSKMQMQKVGGGAKVARARMVHPPPPAGRRNWAAAVRCTSASFSDKRVRCANIFEWCRSLLKNKLSKVSMKTPARHRSTPKKSFVIRANLIGYSIMKEFSKRSNQIFKYWHRWGDIEFAPHSMARTCQDPIRINDCDRQKRGVEGYFPPA